MLPELQEKRGKPLEDRWNHWLNGFEPGSVVFCAFGTQFFLEKEQFQELCLGMELTGLPFLVAVKPPKGSSTTQEALPEGFEERVKGHCDIPQLADQVLTTRLLAEELEVSVKVQREDSGWFSKESLRDAVISVMDKDGEIGKLVRRNHRTLKETLVSPGLLSGYADKFVEVLENEVHNTKLC
ncbi:unnamed protein product [Microthlaspi erraticum]|uniref:Uncharacterized protein n=1 Tax=Microthlaspi erraticum TaxID=1685480 RepID=A0A6D2K8D2_9BRAS|nr:unnamed protein product [Microthlaspi erraticum]